MKEGIILSFSTKRIRSNKSRIEILVVTITQEQERIAAFEIAAGGRIRQHELIQACSCSESYSILPVLS